MVEHNGMWANFSAKLTGIGHREHTIVMYSTDNGAETFTWPDGGTNHVRSEKITNWEGGYRVPTLSVWRRDKSPATLNN